MKWKDMEAKVLKALDGEKRSWVRESVNLDRDNDLWDKSREELQAMFPQRKKKPASVPVRHGLSDAACVKTLVWQEWLKIKVKEHEAIKGNLRTFWYRIMEPFYIAKDILESDREPPLSVIMIACAEADPDRLKWWGGSARSPKELREAVEREAPGLVEQVWRRNREGYLQNLVSRCVDVFVLKGIFRFQDEFEFNDPREGFRIIGKKRARIVFFTEKEGLWWLCEYAAKEHGITAIASKGESGLLAMEYFYDALRRAKVGTVKIGAITDYDPWGAKIAGNFIKKMGLSIFFGEENVSGTALDATQDDLKRFFTPEEIERGKRDLRKYSQFKQSQVEKWFKVTNGIDGGYYGIHVDLANRDRLRKEVDRWVKTV